MPTTIFAHIINRTFSMMYPHSFNLTWGKRFRYDMDPPHTRDSEHVIPTTTNLPGFGPGVRNEFWFACCGRENSPSGSEGSLIISEHEEYGCVCKIYFNYPYLGKNRVEISEVRPGFSVEVKGNPEESAVEDTLFRPPVDYVSITISGAATEPDKVKKVKVGGGLVSVYYVDDGK